MPAKHTLDGGFSLTTPDGKEYSYTGEEMEDVWFANRELIKEHENWEPSTLDIVDMFKDENGEVHAPSVNGLKKTEKDYKAELKKLIDLEAKIDDHVRKLRGLTKSQKKEKAETMKIVYISWKKDAVLKKLQRVENILSLVGRAQRGVTNDNGLDFAKAKAYPITQLVKFNRAGFACCVWHNEKTGSMKYYKKDNHVYCFGCHRGGDAIDVVQALNGCEVKEAVDFLTR